MLPLFHSIVNNLNNDKLTTNSITNIFDYSVHFSIDPIETMYSINDKFTNHYFKSQLVRLYN